MRNAAIRDKYLPNPDVLIRVKGIARRMAVNQQAIVLEVLRECIRQAGLPEEDPDVETQATAAA